MRATCKWWSAERGYGFARPDDGGPDVFVHVTQIEKAGYAALEEGQTISYELGTSPRTGKPMATQIEVVEPIMSPALRSGRPRMRVWP